MFGAAGSILSMTKVLSKDKSVSNSTIENSVDNTQNFNRIRERRDGIDAGSYNSIHDIGFLSSETSLHFVQKSDSISDVVTAAAVAAVHKISQRALALSRLFHQKYKKIKKLIFLF